jgi:hypothetical protein
MPGQPPHSSSEHEDKSSNQPSIEGYFATPVKYLESSLTLCRCLEDTQVGLSAALRVFGTVELMEMILLNTPMRNLFTIQATNKSFRGNIRSSIKLRRKMFLEPEPHAAAGSPESWPAKLNPLLYATMLPLHQRGRERHYDQWTSASGLRLIPIMHLQSMTTAQCLTLMREETSLCIQFRSQCQFLCVPFLMAAGERVANESWAQMIAVQHAPAKILVKLGGTKYPSSYLNERISMFDGACTLGKLYDWRQAQLKRESPHGRRWYQ